MISNAEIADFKGYVQALVGDTFDYSTVIQPLPADPTSVFTIRGTGSTNTTFQLVSNFSASEADFETLLFSPQLGILFTGDLAFGINAHLFLGPTVNYTRLLTWKTQMAYIQQLVSSRPGVTWTLYPGHGATTTSVVQQLTTNVGYLNFFVQSLCARKGNITLVIADMISQYPTYGDLALTYLPYNAQTWLATALDPKGPCAPTTTTAAAASATTTTSSTATTTTTTTTSKSSDASAWRVCLFVMMCSLALLL